MADKSRLYGLLPQHATEPPKRLDNESDSEYLNRMIGLLRPPEGASTAPGEPAAAGAEDGCTCGLTTCWECRI